MKYLVSTSIILLSLLTSAAHAELKAAFLNSAIILQEAPQAREASEAMKKEFSDREQALRALAEEIKTAEENWQKDSAIMSDEQKKKKENEKSQPKWEENNKNAKERSNISTAATKRLKMKKN